MGGCGILPVKYNLHVTFCEKVTEPCIQRSIDAITGKFTLEIFVQDTVECFREIKVTGYVYLASFVEVC
ncbi:hypothetical protein DPMN_108391 [Dreissena polymorpha]|uniref:Uncharacterized protein n=1 Tax=Dreissena polymorpha TaxID=45954 RepID=A0A9D4K8P7_DREPO|nr:hypothetical protein DPMN_108391 [Dreissena polymorpha]